MKFLSHGTSSAVINTQLKFKERDKIKNSSLIPFVRYSEKKQLCRCQDSKKVPI